MQAPNTRSKASVLRRISLLLLSIINIGSSVHTCLSIEKASSCACSYLNSMSFYVSPVSSRGIRE
jgi:hypothetical protein